MVKLGSHNTLTYLPVLKWWMKPIKFMAQCQETSIEEQYNKYNVRLFDIRIFFINKKPIIAHGAIKFKGDIYNILNWINGLDDIIYTRIILEENHPNETDEDEKLFKEFCYEIENKYRNIKFFGGRRKYDWLVLFQFKNEDPSLDDKYSSTTWKIYDDWFPRLYAITHNKKNKLLGTNKDFLFIDFVNKT